MAIYYTYILAAILFVAATVPLFASDIDHMRDIKK